MAKKTVSIVILVLALLAPVFSAGSSPAAIDQTRETPVVKAVRAVAPAVVNIRTVNVVEKRQSPFAPFPRDEFFRRFFEDFFDSQLDRPRATSSLGSGVIIDGKRGFILTNNHVVMEASSIKVMLASGDEFDASVVGTDPESDLAVLRFDAGHPMPEVKMGTSGDLMIGETVIAIGNPFGLSHTVTTGVVSATKRSFRTEKRAFHDFIQTDASINPGNSGGPLLNIDGELIGINTAIYSKAEGIGFAIPIDRAKRIVAELIKYGEVHTAWFGVDVQDLTPELASHFKTPDGRGVLVSGVTKGGPGEKSGLSRGDVIVAINEEPVAARSDYDRILETVLPDGQVRVSYYRQGKKYGARMVAQVFPAELAEEWFYDTTGLRMARKGDRVGLEIVGIRPDSTAQSIGLKPGDIVRSINDITLKSEEDLRKAILKYRNKGPATFLVQRGAYGYYLTIDL